MHSFSMIKYEIATPSAKQKARNDNGALIPLRKELSLKPIPIDASDSEAISLRLPRLSFGKSRDDGFFSLKGDYLNLF
ncbi:hypothetical protein H5T88_09965 [bacterium]|nr:hypothetical protein [bacterium]